MGQTADAVTQTVQGAAYAAADIARQGAGWAATPGAGRNATSYTRPAPSGAAPSAPPSGATGTAGGQAQGWGPMPPQASGQSRR